MKLDTGTVKAIAETTIEILRKEEAADAERRHGRMRNNVKWLLRNYCTLREHCKNAVYSPETAEDEGLLEILMQLSGDRPGSHLKLDSVKMSAAKTRLIVDHITSMVNVYYEICLRSGKPEDLRRYRVLCALYFVENPQEVEEVAVSESVDVRTIYRDIDSAVESLVALIFGIDGLELLRRERNYEKHSYI